MPADFDYLYYVSEGGRKRPSVCADAKLYAIKKGNGAFLVIIYVDNTVSSDTPNGNKIFDSVQASYDWHKERYTEFAGSMLGFSHLNILFELEEFL